MPRPSDSNESRNAITLVHMRKVVGIAGLCYTRYGKLVGVCVTQGRILGFVLCPYPVHISWFSSEFGGCNQ